MITRFIYCISITLSFTILTALQSCKEPAYVCDIDFTLADQSIALGVDTIYISGEVVFEVSAAKPYTCYLPTKPVQEATMGNIVLPRYKWKNDLDTGTFSLSFNREIVLNGNTLPSGTDLFKQDYFKSEVILGPYQSGFSRGLGCTITFPYSLLRHMQFDQEPYILTFSCATTDKRYLVKQRAVIFQ